MRNRLTLTLAWLAALSVVVALLSISPAPSVAAQADPASTPTPTTTGASVDVTETATATETPTATSTPTGTATPTPTDTSSAVDTPTASATPTATATFTATATPTASATTGATLTPSATPTPSATATPFTLYMPYVVRVHPEAPIVYALNANLVGDQVRLTWRGEKAARATYVYRVFNSNPANVYRELLETLPGDVWEHTRPIPDGGASYQVVRVNAHGSMISEVAGANYVAPPPSPTPTPTSAPNTGLIYGRMWTVTSIGFAPGLRVQLRKFDGQRLVTVAETLTSDNPHTAYTGQYAFRDVPTPGPDEYYQVVFPNAEGYSGLLAAWYGPRIRAFAPGQAVHGGSPGLVSPVLNTPADGARLDLPVSFSWAYEQAMQRRYRLLLYDASDPSQSWLTNDLGEVTSFSLRGLPSGMQRGRPYAWTVIVNYEELTGSYGVAYETRRFTIR